MFFNYCLLASIIPIQIYTLWHGDMGFSGWTDLVDAQYFYNYIPTILNCFVFTWPTGKYFVTGSSDQTVKVWLYNEGVPTHVGVGHAGVVTNVRVSPDGRYLVSTSMDGGIFLWCFPHDPDIEQPSSRCSNISGMSAGEQQTVRSRQLSLKKSMPIRKENISDISSAQKVMSVLADVGASGDGDAARAGSRGSLKICKSSSSIR